MGDHLFQFYFGLDFGERSFNHMNKFVTISELMKAENTKSQSTLSKIFIQFIWHIDYVTISRKSI